MSMKVLVVDDDPDVVKMVEFRLKKEGYKIIVGRDGAEAIELVKNNKEISTIILDVMMPPPNGFQVCRQLKDDNKYRHIPIILLTAKGSDSDQFWGMESGADAYIVKPYSTDDLLAKIASFDT